MLPTRVETTVHPQAAASSAGSACLPSLAQTSTVPVLYHVGHLRRACACAGRTNRPAAARTRCRAAQALLQRAGGRRSLSLAPVELRADPQHLRPARVAGGRVTEKMSRSTPLAIRRWCSATGRCRSQHSRLLKIHAIGDRHGVELTRVGAEIRSSSRPPACSASAGGGARPRRCAARELAQQEHDIGGLVTERRIDIGRPRLERSDRDLEIGRRVLLDRARLVMVRPPSTS